MCLLAIFLASVVKWPLFATGAPAWGAGLMPQPVFSITYHDNVIENNQKILTSPKFPIGKEQYHRVVHLKTNDELAGATRRRCK
jgi:hypothetical protein